MHRRRQPDLGERYQQWWIRVFAALDGLSGATYVLGGQANSPGLLLMQQALPIQVFGAVLVAVGVLLLFRHHQWGGVLGAVVWLVYALTSLITVVTGTALSAGGPVLLLGLAVFHILITYGAVRGLSSLAQKG